MVLMAVEVDEAVPSMVNLLFDFLTSNAVI